MSKQWIINSWYIISPYIRYLKNYYSLFEHFLQSIWISNNKGVDSSLVVLLESLKERCPEGWHHHGDSQWLAAILITCRINLEHVTVRPWWGVTLSVSTIANINHFHSSKLLLLWSCGWNLYTMIKSEWSNKGQNQGIIRKAWVKNRRDILREHQPGMQVPSPSRTSRD